MKRENFYYVLREIYIAVMSSSIFKIINPLKSRLVIGLIFISSIFVSSPLIQRHGSINGVDIAFVALVFGGIIALESIAILLLEYFEAKHKAVQILTCMVAGLFLGLNIFNFYFVLTNARPYIYFLMCVPIIIFYIYSKYSAKISKGLIVVSVVMFFVMGTTEVILGSQISAPTNLPGVVTEKHKAKRSVYFISFDALVSERALKELYQTKDRPHIDFLEANNFAVYDVLSPGVDTTNSFVEWFSFGALHGLRNPKDYFNGMTQNPLIDHLKNRGLKLQFVTPSNYFGVDMGLIGAFYPKNYSISICDFMNARYAFGSCHGRIYRNFLEPILLRQDTQISESTYKLASYVIVAKNLAFAASQEITKWFSVSYISFPGHSSMYFSDDAKSIESYRISYIKKLPELKNQFEAIFQLIRDKDPEAVVVFMGDHGGYLTGRWDLFDKNAPEGGSEKLFDLDRRSVLLGVYPGTFCKNEINQISDTSILMKILTDCAL